MKECEAKKYLEQIKELRIEEQNLKYEIAKLDAQLEDIDVSIRSAWPDGQPHGTGTTDPVGNRAASDADRQIEDERRRLIRMKQNARIRQLRHQQMASEKREEIVTNINKVSNADCKDLLYRRYVRGQKWELIAVEMKFSYQWVAGPLHGKALRMMAEVIERYEKP